MNVWFLFTLEEQYERLILIYYTVAGTIWMLGVMNVRSYNEQQRSCLVLSRSILETYVEPLLGLKDKGGDACLRDKL